MLKTDRFHPKTIVFGWTLFKNHVQYASPELAQVCFGSENERIKMTGSPLSVPIDVIMKVMQ